MPVSSGNDGIWKHRQCYFQQIKTFLIARVDSGRLLKEHELGFAAFN
jgi:hypothetical protein